MSGVKGMHARLSTSPNYAEKVRARIKAGGIVFLLQQHIVGKRDMSKTQVAAALGLLRKVVPDCATIDHTGEVTHRYVAEVPTLVPHSAEWLQQHAPTIQ